MNKINKESISENVMLNWYSFVVHHGTENFFEEKYGVIKESPMIWRNKIYIKIK